MKVILEWDGDQADLLDEDNGMSLVDNIIHATYVLSHTSDDYNDGVTLLHNNIKLTIEKE